MADSPGMERLVSGEEPQAQEAYEFADTEQEDDRPPTPPISLDQLMYLQCLHTCKAPVGYYRSSAEAAGNGGCGDTSRATEDVQNCVSDPVFQDSRPGQQGEKDVDAVKNAITISALPARESVHEGESMDTNNGFTKPKTLKQMLAEKRASIVEKMSKKFGLTSLTRSPCVLDSSAAALEDGAARAVGLEAAANIGDKMIDVKMDQEVENGGLWQQRSKILKTPRSWAKTPRGNGSSAPIVSIWSPTSNDDLLKETITGVGALHAGPQMQLLSVPLASSIELGQLTKKEDAKTPADGFKESQDMSYVIDFKRTSDKGPVPVMHNLWEEQNRLKTFATACPVQAEELAGENLQISNSVREGRALETLRKSKGVFKLDDDQNTRKDRGTHEISSFFAQTEDAPSDLAAVTAAGREIPEQESMGSKKKGQDTPRKDFEIEDLITAMNEALASSRSPLRGLQVLYLCCCAHVYARYLCRAEQPHWVSLRVLLLTAHIDFLSIGESDR